MTDMQARKELEDNFFEKRETYTPGNFVLSIKGENGIDEFIGKKASEAYGAALRKYDIATGDRPLLVMEIFPRNPRIR